MTWPFSKILLSFLKAFWREVLIVSLCVSFYAYIGFKNSEMKDLVIERNQYKSALEYQNATIIKKAEEYEQKSKELPKEIIKIKTRYKVIYENIDDWEGDKNASDCENASSYLHSFNY